MIVSVSCQLDGIQNHLRDLTSDLACGGSYELSGWDCRKDRSELGAGRRQSGLRLAVEPGKVCKDPPSPPTEVISALSLL